jgi:glycosyltransferase involved in cell wall biosynthesis
MVIAVDIKDSEKYQNFVHEIFKRITAKHPQHTFIFIFDQPFDLSLGVSENVIPIVVSKTKTILLSRLRANHKTSSLLKKYKADVYVTSRILSLTKVSQCLIALDSTPGKSLKKANLIIADSAFSKKNITEKYKINPEKICIVYKGVEEIFKPLSFEEKEIIKEQYSEANEYFLVAGIFQSKNSLLDLLKAFSAFKKMQKSNMQLIIIPQTEVDKEIAEALRLFKYKGDVKILQNIDIKELAGITGAAYALIYAVANDGYSQILEAMKCDVPVIASHLGAIPEVASQAALVISSNNHKDIADKMMLIYKDEKLRQQVIDKGREEVKKYSWDNSAVSFWKCIEKACWLYLSLPTYESVFHKNRCPSGSK